LNLKQKMAAFVSFYLVFGIVNLRERDHLKEPGVDGRIILKWIFKKWDGGMDWIDMAQDRDRWRAGVSAVMNLRVQKTRGIS
jgi:hypothetical protein